jgi:hypothetical protein
VHIENASGPSGTQNWYAKEFYLLNFSLKSTFTFTENGRSHLYSAVPELRPFTRWESKRICRMKF